jgi:hypothetical protein
MDQGESTFGSYLWSVKQAKNQWKRMLVGESSDSLQLHVTYRNNFALECMIKE